jgi:hypothetical protein
MPALGAVLLTADARERRVRGMAVLVDGQGLVDMFRSTSTATSIGPWNAGLGLAASIVSVRRHPSMCDAPAPPRTRRPRTWSPQATNAFASLLISPLPNTYVWVALISSPCRWKPSLSSLTTFSKARFTRA